MSNLRKLSTFRQLSLSCESPIPQQRRKSLRKQYSEDLAENWLDPEIGIKISLNSKTRKDLDKPPPVKIAWEENTKNFKTEDAVIIKKCAEIKRPKTSKLTRHSSLENDSILYTKTNSSERIIPKQENTDSEKPNLNIFLAYTPKQTSDEFFTKTIVNNINNKPKLMQPLLNPDKNIFQIRKKNKQKINLHQVTHSPTRTKEKQDEDEFPKEIVETCEEIHNLNNLAEYAEPKAINNVIIRPATAASKRDKFQKRTNSAFHQTVKEVPTNFRPPLIRSSSAPSKPDHAKSKFIATKRKIKSAKRTQFKTSQSVDEEDTSNSNKENPKSQKVLNRTVSVNGTDIVTMVSLVSPDASDVEEIVEEVKTKEKGKNEESPRKNDNKNNMPKNLSLRKTVKSVSFQQSSIHSIRSFSASFPARRSSVATSLMFANKGKTPNNREKANEKRSTNSAVRDDDERVPKRRFVKSNTIDTSEATSNDVKSEELNSQSDSNTDIEDMPNSPKISVDIKTKETATASTGIADIEEQKIENKIEDHAEENKTEPSTKPIEETVITSEPKFESTKEKQCWDMYRKMSDKGINVSYDTILRGMLTPTEYRMRRKEVQPTPTTDNDDC